MHGYARVLTAGILSAGAAASPALGGIQAAGAGTTATAGTARHGLVSGRARGRFGVQPLADSAVYSLFVIDPGQTRTIDVTIKPAGAPGTIITVRDCRLRS